MQMGECPYEGCDDHRIRILPDRPLPLFSKEECPGCKRTIWVYYSRVDPKVYTEADFAKEFDVDESTKNITHKAAPQTHGEVS